MKNRIIKTVVALLVSTALVGCNTLEVNKEQTKQVITDNTIDIHNIDWGNVKIYHSTDKESFDKLTPILENRNGQIIIEVIEGTVLDVDGNGKDDTEHYIKYDKNRFSIGNRVQTVYIYNPNSNALDDVLYRIDTLME